MNSATEYTSSDRKIVRQSENSTIQPPRMGAMAGAIVKIIVTSESRRAAAASEYRSRMMARPTTTPAPDEMPCMMRNTHR